MIMGSRFHPMRDPQNPKQKAANEGVSYHIDSLVDSCSPESLELAEVSSEGLLGRLARVLFPYHGHKYPGRIKGVCNLLGIAPGTYAKRSKPSGAHLVSPGLCEKAAGVCRSQALELERLAGEFEKRGAVLRAAIPKRRGMLVVKVRDASGIPRTARGWGRGDGVICHDPAKPDPF